MAQGDAEKIIAALGEELRGIRAGRATPALVEGIKVECYGGLMALQSVAAIGVPDSRTILIEPWDRTLVPSIVVALERSALGLNPVVDQQKVRLTLPPLTEERRKELGRLISQKTEEARVKIRKVREEARERITAEERAKKISEDEKFRRLKALDKEVEGWMERVEALRKKKEGEMLA